ncbi:MAG: hypothetical protein M1476_04115 [Candidatus Thermoplasmatota archaeon]|nr:hypothetical protein [Candidatus Thermoplasmatota archaeon]
MVGSAFALIGNSMAINPQVGKVSYRVNYDLNGGSIGLASSSTVLNITTPAGIFVKSYTGNGQTISLPYGSYIFSVGPIETQSGTKLVIANGTSALVNVTQSTPTVYLNQTVYNTKNTSVTLVGLITGSATVSFATPQGFVFQRNVTSNGKIVANLPIGGKFFTNVAYGGYVYTFYNNTTSSGTPATMTVNLIATSSKYGYVESPSGSSINSFKVVALNTSAPKTYTVTGFSGGSFQINEPQGASNIYVVEANGYQPYQLNINNFKNGNIVTLQPGSGNVSYNFTIGNNPGYLNVSVTYDLSNSTTFPFAGNSTVGSLYWQQKLDTKFNTTVLSYMGNIIGNYTNNSILVNGYNYNLTYAGTASNTTLPSNGEQFKVNFTYKNLNASSINLNNGFNVKLYALGTLNLPGSLYYHYQLKYNASGVALTSPTSVGETFKSPVNITPQSQNGWLSLSFSKPAPPVVYASEINLFWSGMLSHNYLVSSSALNTTFVAPVNKLVSFNLSQAYHSATGESYLKALNYTWATAATVAGEHTYNMTANFTTVGTHMVSVTYISASGATNTTYFNVTTMSPASPNPALTVSSTGKTLFTQPPSTNSTFAFAVPQSKAISFSAYASSLSTGGISVPLSYAWYFPGAKYTGANVSQTFNTPTLGGSNTTGYLDVYSAIGPMQNVTLSILVNDTTPPTPQISFQNVTGSSIAQPIAGQITKFSANLSSDTYYGKLNLSPKSKWTVNWTIGYVNGTQAPQGNSTYELLPNFNNQSLTNQSYIVVQFNTLNSLVVSLKVTNPAGVSAYSNRTVSVIVQSPRLVIQSVYFPMTPSQGSATIVDVNVSNNGTTTANSFTIVAYVNGKNISWQKYSNSSLAVGVTKEFKFNLTSPSSGSVQFQFEAQNVSEPQFFFKAGSLAVTQTVNQPAYKTPLVIGVVVAVIVLIGVAYYKLSSGGTSSKPKKEAQPKTQLKKPEEKKK